MENKESRYKIIWLKLKRDKVAEIAAPPEFHARLIKAIKKRKNLDVAYKFFLGEQYKVAVLSFQSEQSLLKVTLTVKTRSDYI